MRRSSLVTRIATTATLSLVFFAIGMVVLIKTDIERTIYSETDTRVQIAQNVFLNLITSKGTPSLRFGVLRLGKWVANSDNSLVDYEHKLAGTDATLFAIDHGMPIRISTTIRKLSGSRNVGTELLGPARLAFDAGRGFKGVSPVAGRQFLNRYDILRDAAGRSVGIAYTGIPLTSMYDAEWRMMRIVMFGAGVALVLSLASLYLVLRPLRRAFDDAITMAEGLAVGEVIQLSRPNKNDELGQVRRAFDQMIDYHERMATIADALANGEFAAEVQPASDRDRLGVAFSAMKRNLCELMAQLENSAMSDSLTQLGNRRAFEARLHAELARVSRHGGELSLGLIDLDFFKAVNDEYGHQHGDVVLTRLATILQHVRAEDSAFRLGGDEFAVIIQGGTEDAKRALTRICAEAKAEYLGTTLTAGVSTSSPGFTDDDILRRQADAALYVGKQRGRNIVVTFDEAQSRGAIPQHMNVNAVVRLIAEQGIEAHFQPIWDLERRALLGFEALARPLPRYELSGPQEAFDVAAKIGRTNELDRICRTAAITAAIDLPDGTMLFLNVSPETLARGYLEPETLAASLAEVGICPERVVLEITEKYDGMSGPVIAAAEALQRFGFKLALDDTGAGNAGLEYLSRTRVDFIKLDGAIVANAVHDTAARGVVAAIIALAATTGAYVIAEGIENQAMLHAVSRMLLDSSRPQFSKGGVQGYYLGRPGPGFQTGDKLPAAVAQPL